jgi:hypothetical protein
MTTQTETFLRDELHSITAAQPFTPDISAIERRGRQLRRRQASGRGLAGLGVAAAVTVAAVTAGTAQGGHAGGRGTEPGSKTPATSPPGQTLSTGQLVLYRLAAASIALPATVGRYVVLSETDTETGDAGASERTSVVDTVTGASTTYQHAVAVDGQAPGSAYTDEPATLTEGPDPTSTEAWFAALPTDPTALRAKLLAVAKQQAAQAEQTLQQQAAPAGKSVSANVQPVLSDDDDVYQEADTLLWSPLVQPTLRAALYKVLAGTSGFTVHTQATDPSGRAAIAMTRHDNGVPGTDTTFEDPATGAVLAQVWQEGGDTITAVYQPVTGSVTVPADPYPG